MDLVYNLVWLYIFSVIFSIVSVFLASYAFLKDLKATKEMNYLGSGGSGDLNDNNKWNFVLYPVINVILSLFVLTYAAIYHNYALGNTDFNIVKWSNDDEG